MRYFMILALLLLAACSTPVADPQKITVTDEIGNAPLERSFDIKANVIKPYEVCIDSDGLNLTIKGNVSFNKSVYHDTCHIEYKKRPDVTACEGLGCRIKEFYCEDNTLREELARCSNCSKGVCLDI